MKPFLGLIFAALLLAACERNKFESKPTIEVKDVDKRVVPLNDSLTVVLEYTDKEGDIDDSLYIWKTRLNQRVLETVRDSIPARKIPEAPDESKGELLLRLTYQNYLISAKDPSIPGNPNEKEPDTLRFKFMIKDKAGNRSDTAFLEPIIIIR